MHTYLYTVVGICNIGICVLFLGGNVYPTNPIANTLVAYDFAHKIKCFQKGEMYSVLLLYMGHIMHTTSHHMTSTLSLTT